MIFLDANIILRYLLQATTPTLVAMQEIANGLFAAVDQGGEEATTTEIVFHEVA